MEDPMLYCKVGEEKEIFRHLKR